MLYYEGLEEVIFSKHDLLSEEPDEFIVISGFLGPSPVNRLKELNKMKITVIGGMYPNGVDARLLASLNKINKENKNLQLFFSNQEIHSKIYIWKKNGKTLAALIGSANFSSNGLRNDYRETLADATRDTFIPLENYFKIILQNSTNNPKLRKDQKNINISGTSNINKSTIAKVTSPIDISLLDETNEVPIASGLNWGCARLKSDAHVSQGDAYIRIPKQIIIDNPDFINAFDSDYKTPEGRRKRQSDPIELIWDDGVIMEASLEGIQKLDGQLYPKQLASYSSKTPYLEGKRISKKSILGRYLRKRLDVGIDEIITKKTLENYGRSTISLSLLSDGVYFADFSVNKK